MMTIPEMIKELNNVEEYYRDKFDGVYDISSMAKDCKVTICQLYEENKRLKKELKDNV